MALTAVWILFGLFAIVMEGLGDSYKFSCDFTPTQHDNILEKVIANLEQGISSSMQVHSSHVFIATYL